MKHFTDKNIVKEILERSVEKIYPSKEALEKALSEGRRLRIYLGADPTGPHLHLGHLTNLLALKKLQQLGHEIIFLVGDFTAQIGDPTDKLAPRQPLSQKEIKENYKTFKKQVSRIIKFTGANAAKIKFNSKWLNKMKFVDVIRLAQNFTVQQMIQRDMFQERIKSDKPIGVHEFLYPLMQGYDSVVMDVDMEIGGNDQTFNMLVGRDLMKIYNNKEKFVLTTKLLINPKTGRKLMNKSEGGLINLDDRPEEIFGKVMALVDEAMFEVAELSTEMPTDKINSLKEAVLNNQMNPRDAKLEIAEAVIQTLYDEKAANASKAEFLKLFSKHEKPEEIPLRKLSAVNYKLIDLLIETKLASSKSEARRLIEQGGVKINDEKKTNPDEIIPIGQEFILQVGKRHFLKVSR